MTAYMTAHITIHDRERYAEYEAGFMEIFERYNGSLSAVDEAPTVLEGKWEATRLVMVQFPSREDALAWFQSEAYQALADHRRAASVGTILLTDSTTLEASTA